MAETQATPEVGTFCWNELMTPDATKASAFYTKLFGWTTAAMDMGPAGTYTLFKQGEKSVGGCMQISPEMGPMPPHWMSYVAVANVDETAKQVVALGGTVVMPPTDIPTVGRFMVFTDPTGATMAAITFPQG